MHNTEGEAIYPGTCRRAAHHAHTHSLRLRVGEHNATQISFTDRACGTVSQDVALDVGDFVLRRADGLYAYQLAVVADDAFQGITDVVRGADLLLNTPRQIFLQRCLGVASPRYLHVPLVRNAAGEKLSKQTRATAISADNAIETLRAAWSFLRQADIGQVESVSAFWRVAITLWNADRCVSRAQNL